MSNTAILTVETILNSLALDRNVIDSALLIYSKELKPLNLSLKKTNQAFLALMEAYKKEGVPPDMNYINTVFSLSKDQVKKTLKCASRNGYNIIIHKYLPKDFLNEFSRLVGIHIDHLPFISALCDKLLLYNPHFNETKPQDIAAAAVLYYGGNKGYNIDLKSYSSQTKVAKSSLEIIKKVLAIADKLVESNQQNKQ